MSEKLTPRHEHAGEKLHLHELSDENLEKIQEKARGVEHTAEDTIDKIRKTIEKQAISGKEVVHTTSEDKSQKHPFGLHKELKHNAYQSVLRNARSELSRPKQMFSKIIHQPTVDKVSEVATKTVARPTGILTGGIITFCGSLFLLFYARKYGFEYNYLVFIFLFIGGYLAGLCIETISYLIGKRVKR